MKKSFKSSLAVILSIAMILAAGMPHAFAAQVGMSSDGKYYTDFETLEEAQAAANIVAQQIAAEGNVLLKNQDETLPLSGKEYISVFGVGQDNMSGQSGTNVRLQQALEEEGFKLNPTLLSYYAKDNTSVSRTFAERVDFNHSIENSFAMYGDAAIIVLSRGGGEGSDIATVTDEEASEEELAAHKGYVAQEDGKIYKHFLQMTNTELELLDYVKAQGFKKIIYLINSSEIFELGDLENDEDVDAILWIGRPGQSGLLSSAGILSGRINPSGRTVDTWYRDFTADPTWQNVTNNKQSVGKDGVTYVLPGEEADGEEGGGIVVSSTSYHGIDYEEGIYLGYRYYETRAFDMGEDGADWYADAVVYPFGYGLSYTTFAFNSIKVTLDNGTVIEGGDSIDAALLGSVIGQEAEVKTLTVEVEVENTGSVAGKEVVEIYINAPYTPGEVEKAAVKLVGFGKTSELRPGKKETLKITVNVQDLASYDADDANGNGTKGYELDEGDYVLYALDNAHGWANPDGDCYQAVEFAIDGDVYMQLDDFSGNEVKNLFSIENGLFYTMRLNDGKYQFNDDATATMTQMSRADFEGTFPKAPTEADLTISQATKTALEYWDKFTADKPDEYGDGKYIEGVMWEDDEYQSDYPWIAEVDAAADRIANWTQTGEYGITVAEMAGIDPFGEEVIESGRFEGKTGIEAWDEFMNTLTYKDVMDVVGQYQKRAFPAVSMNALSGQDSAWNYASTFNFTCNCTLAATWNVELSRKKGILIANMALLRGSNTWWGNSANTHRSPFGGRAFEYTSEDSFLGGAISSNETLGAVSRGLMTSMKHCALNDQETFRNGLNLLTWVSEQAARELYFKSFQMCAQEGQSTGLMGAFARAGRVSINVNYNFCTELVRNEWGSQTICITTDNYGGMRNCSPLDLLVRAGTDNIDSNTMSGTWDETLRDGLGAVVIGGEEKTESTIQWYTTRKMAMVFLFTHANTAMNKNGVDTSGWEGAEFEGVQAANVRESVVLEGDFDSVRYEISNGALPAGVTLNGETGAISGTPTSKAGTYSFTVRAVVENWITATQRFTINLDSAFEIDETNGKVGEDFYAVISSDSVNDEHYNQGVVYSVKSGSLPKGITLNEDGELEGVPEEAGVFTVLFNVQASNRGSGSRATTTVTNFEYEVTLTIEGDEVAEARVIRALERNARLFNAKALLLR